MSNEGDPPLLQDPESSHLPRRQSDVPAESPSILQTFRVGAQTGMNLETFGGRDADSAALEAATKIGFSSGGTLGIDVHTYVAIQSGILYTTKGSAFELNGETDLWINLSYLQIPISVHGRIPLGGKTTRYIGDRSFPYIVGGAALRILTSSEVKRVDGGSRDANDDTAGTDIGLFLGAGLNIAIPWNGAITIEAVHDRGLLSIDDSGGGDELLNRSFTFTVGYRAPLECLLGCSDRTRPGQDDARTPPPEPRKSIAPPTDP